MGVKALELEIGTWVRKRIAELWSGFDQDVPVHAEKTWEESLLSKAEVRIEE